MNNKWKEMRDWVWKDQQSNANYAALPSVPIPPEVLALAKPEVIVAALNHYCSLCHRGFKTVGATNAHKTIKHKHE